MKIFLFCVKGVHTMVFDRPHKIISFALPIKLDGVKRMSAVERAVGSAI